MEGGGRRVWRQGGREAKGSTNREGCVARGAWTVDVWGECAASARESGTRDMYRTRLSVQAV